MYQATLIAVIALVFFVIFRKSEEKWLRTLSWIALGVAAVSAAVLLIGALSIFGS